jgi:hypothetical protein
VEGSGVDKALPCARSLSYNTIINPRQKHLILSELSTVVLKKYLISFTAAFIYCLINDLKILSGAYEITSARHAMSFKSKSC